MVPGLSEVSQVAAGEDHSLARTRDQRVLAWGDNLYGQLADGTWDVRERPAPVVGMVPATAIATGGAHILALTSKGTVFTWGFGNEGQLGDNAIIRRRAVPVAVTAVALVPGPDFSSPAFRPVPSTESTWLAPVVKRAGDVFTVRGKAESSTAYVIAAAAVTAGPDEDLKVLAARGTVNKGCVTVGVQENNQWIFYKNYSEPGLFTLTWPGVCPGVKTHRQPGRPGTDPSSGRGRTRPPRSIGPLG